ncbi:MAG: sugar ABC transporter permease [Treponemataceae bacterium]|nr:sugar ABC transporter permease [Treponemataceae bacterium]
MTDKTKTIKKSKVDTRDLLTFIGFVAPGLLVYLFIIIYPIFYSVYLSFTDYNPNIGRASGFVGFKNYITVMTMNKGVIDASNQTPEFWHAFKNNMLVVCVSVFGQIPIGFALAFILYRKQVKGAKMFQAMVFLPNFLSTIVIGIMWRMLFNVDGPVATVMQKLSGDPTRQFTLMYDPSKAMIPIAIVLIWMYTGFYMIIFLANLQKINESMFEAAKIDGASEFQMFYKITIPLMAAPILTSCILAIAGSLKGFALIFALASDGKPRMNTEVLPIFMYNQVFGMAGLGNEKRYAYGAAISNIIVLISVILIMFSNWVGKKLGTDEEY